MHKLRLLDLEIDLPNDVRVKADPPRECRTLYTLEGPGLLDIRAKLEEAAQSLSYDVASTEAASHIHRGERRIEIFYLSSGGLGLRVDDAESLPRAQVLTGGIRIADYLLPVPHGATIEPGRERHDSGSNSWSAEWRINAADAAELARGMHDALLKAGLHSGGIWTPPKGGIPRWKVEASSRDQLVQVGIIEQADHVVVNATVIQAQP